LFFGNINLRFQGKDGHRFLAALFQVDPTQSVLVVAAHFTARESKRAQRIRQEEFKNLNIAINNMMKNESDEIWCEILTQTIQENKIIICGDLNL
jgi:endonuclease/exonuclease/phosphatase family metal-dependent hydrolase